MIKKITDNKDYLTELVMNLIEQGNTHFIPKGGPIIWEFEDAIEVIRFGDLNLVC